MEEAWERALDAACAGEDPSTLRSLTLDGVLKCSQGRLPSPSLFRRFSQLRVLSIANVGLTSLAGFPSLPHLQRLVLSDNRISGGLEHLVNAGLHVLRDLDLSNNKIVLLSSLAPLSGLSLLSLDLYECPVTRVPNYRTEVFSMIETLQFLDKVDAENNERLESDEEEEDDDDDDDEDEVDDELTDGIEANGDEEDGGKSNGLAASSNGLEEEEDGDEDEDRDGDESEEVDEDEEEQAPAVASAAGYQDLGKANYLGGQSNDGSGSDEEEVDDDEGGDNVVEVQEVEESEEDDDDDDDEDEEEVEVGDDDDSEEEAGEDEQDDDQDEDDVEEEVEEAVSVRQFGGADGVIDAQDNEDDGEEENGEIGDEDDDEGDGIDNNDGDEEDDDDDDEEDDYGTEYLDSSNFINQSGHQLVRSIHCLSQVLQHILSSKSSEASNNDDAMALQSIIYALSSCLLKQTRRGLASDSDINENLKTNDKPTNKNQGNLPLSDHAIEGIEKENSKLKSGFPADGLPPKIVEMGDFYERVARLQHLLQMLEGVVSYELNESSAIVNLYQNFWRTVATAISSLSMEIQEAKKNLVVTQQSLSTLEMAGKENHMSEYVACETATKTADGFKEISSIGEIDIGSLFPQGTEFDGCGKIQSTPITNVSKQANAYCKLADSASNVPKKDFDKGREYQCDDRRGSERRVVHHSKQKDGFANKKVVITTPCQDSSTTKMSFTKEEPGIITERNKSDEMDQSSALNKIIKNNSETNCVSFNEGYLATGVSFTKEQPGIVTGRNKSKEVDIDQVLHGFQLHNCEAKNICSSDLNSSNLWELEGLGDREIIFLKTNKTNNQLVYVDGDSEWEHVVKW